jgi:hypothetical protein
MSLETILEVFHSVVKLFSVMSASIKWDKRKRKIKKSKSDTRNIKGSNDAKKNE